MSLLTTQKHLSNNNVKMLLGLLFKAIQNLASIHSDPLYILFHDHKKPLILLTTNLPASSQSLLLRIFPYFFATWYFLRSTILLFRVWIWVLIVHVIITHIHVDIELHITFSDVEFWQVILLHFWLFTFLVHHLCLIPLERSIPLVEYRAWMLVFFWDFLSYSFQSLLYFSIDFECLAFLPTVEAGISIQSQTMVDKLLQIEYIGVIALDSSNWNGNEFRCAI